MKNTDLLIQAISFCVKKPLLHVINIYRVRQRAGVGSKMTLVQKEQMATLNYTDGIINFKKIN